MVALRSVDVLSELDSATEFVTRLVPTLPEDVLPLTLETSLRSGQPEARLALLMTQAPRIMGDDLSSLISKFLTKKSEELENAKLSDAEFESDYQLTKSLTGLSPFVPQELREQFITVVRTLGNPATRADLLLRFAVDWQQSESDRNALIEEAWQNWQEREPNSWWGDLAGDDKNLSPLMALPHEWQQRWIGELAGEAFQQTSDESNSFSLDEKRRFIWPLLAQQFQDKWLREQISAALSLPEELEFTYDSYGYKSNHPVYPRAEKLKNLKFYLSDTLLPDALATTRTIANNEARFEVLVELCFLGPHNALRFQAGTYKMLVEVCEILTPDQNTIRSFASLAYYAEGNLREDIAKTGFELLKRLTEGQAYALRELGPYLPTSFISQAIELLSRIEDDEEKGDYSEYLLQHFAPKWPESALLLRPLVNSEFQYMLAVVKVWLTLPLEIRDSLHPLLIEGFWKAIEQLEELVFSDSAPTNDEEEDDEALFREARKHSELQDVVLELLQFIPRDSQINALQRIQSLSVGEDLLRKLLVRLPSDLQSSVALSILRDEQKSYSLTETDDYDWVFRFTQIAPYLPKQERTTVFDKLVEAIGLKAVRQSTSNSVEVDIEEQNGSISFWGDLLGTIRSILPLLVESQLRQLLKGIESWPHNADLTSDDVLLTQDEIWPREQIMGLILSRLAIFATGDEARSLMRRVWEFSLFYPYYPEHGGNGADPDPEGMSLSPEEVAEQFQTLNHESQKILLTDLIRNLAKRDASDLYATIHEAIRTTEDQNGNSIVTAVPEELSTSIKSGIPKKTLHLQGRIPSQAIVGQSFTAQLRLSSQASELSVRLNEIQSSKENDTIRLVIYAPDFDLLDGGEQHLLVPNHQPSSWLAFELKPRKEGRLVLKVLAFYASSYLGELTTTLHVGASGTQRKDVPLIGWESSFDLRDTVQNEASWLIDYAVDTHRLRFRVFEPNGEFIDGVSDPIRESLHTWVEQIVENADRQSSSFRRRALAGSGAEIWRQCVPVNIQNQFLGSSSSWKSLKIISQNEGIPWEILCPPTTTGSEPQFLAESLPICRWVPGSAPKQTLFRRNPCFVEAIGVPGSTTEITTIRRLLGAMREDAYPIVHSVKDALTHMDAGDFDWLHFTGHHTFDDSFPIAAGLRLGEETLQAGFLSTIEGRWQEKQPFVFLNGCRTAGRGLSMIGLDGWAERCLRAGAAGFAGSSWTVRNDAALEFATHFYEHLSGGQPLGEAFYDARLQTRDAIENDCSWLAYVLYAHSKATVATLDEE